MKNLTCGFIGLGLIGGSIAKAMKANLPDTTIIAYDINTEALSLAKKHKIADITTTAIDDSFRSCDYLFLCAPVQKNDDNLKAVKEVISPNCILTDVGSVKTDIHMAVREMNLDAQFIGGHPMAGSDRTGFINSKSVLLENAYYILTPTPLVPSSKLAEYKALVEQIGAIPLILSYEQHDYVTAAVSHLPHVIAASLVNLVRDSDSADGIMKMIAAGGFKDITRIASSSAVMWQQICLTNTDNIKTLLDAYISSLNNIKKELESKDSTALYDLFESARIYRDSFINASSGPIKRSFTFKVDIADKPGGLASIVNLLAECCINIKNIGITHNREDEYGVLHLEFYDEESLDTAKKLLRKHKYSIQE